MAYALGRYKASQFRTSQNKFLRSHTEKLSPKSVLNLGAKPGDPDKEGQRYEDYFSGAEYRTMDLGGADGPSHIQADLMALPPDVGQYDLVLAMSTIEHIDRPWVAAPHITALVRPGGHLFIAMPFFYPVHEGPYYGDHWRATPSAMTFLFEKMEVVRTDLFPSTILLVRDRPMYWKEPTNSYCGFAMLMRRPEDAV